LEKRAARNAGLAKKARASAAFFNAHDSIAASKILRLVGNGTGEEGNGVEIRSLDGGEPKAGKTSATL